MGDINHVTKAFRFLAKPRPRQLSMFWSYAESARYSWNWTVALCKNEYEEAKRVAVNGEKPKSPGINRGRLYKEFCQQHQIEEKIKRHPPKDHPYPSLCKTHSHVYSYPIERVVKAYKAWWQALKQKRPGGPPKFKSRGTGDSFTIQIVKWKTRRNQIHVPTLGWIEVWPKIDIPFDEAKPCNITISRTADRWFLSIAAKNVPIEQWEAGRQIVGIDMGVNSVVTLSDGTAIDPPKIYERALRRLQKRSRALSRKKKGSNNRQKAKMALARAHAKAANERSDFCHQLTARIVKSANVIVIEGFDVKDLVSRGVAKEMKGARKRKRRQTILDHAWGEIRRQLTYKANWHGREILTCDKYEKTDKPCCVCGHINETPKTTSQYHCVKCKNTTTRQLNTAMLLESWGRGGTHDEQAAQ